MTADDWQLPAEKSLIHLALVEAFPTEADVREAMASTNGVPYRGVQTHPTPTRSLIHVFSRRAPEQIESAGWGRTDRSHDTQPEYDKPLYRDPAARRRTTMSLNVEILNKCPKCGDPVLVAPMHAGGIRPDPKTGEDVLVHDLALGYQCLACDWYVIQPDSNKLSAAEFLAAVVGPAGPA